MKDTVARGADRPLPAHRAPENAPRVTNGWQPVRVSRSDSERTLSIDRKILATLAMAIVLPVTVAAQTPAGASTPTSAKSLTKDLLPSSYAKKAGFTKVAVKVTTTSKTGVKSCPNGAEEAFESASGQTGLASEVVACTTSKAAAALLSGARSGTSVTSAHPPKRLGSSAIEHLSSASTYQILWQRGTIVEAVALNTNVPASSSSSTSTTVAALPITSAQQKVLSSAAVVQDALLR